MFGIVVTNVAQEDSGDFAGQSIANRSFNTSFCGWIRRIRKDIQQWPKRFSPSRLQSGG
jgi:hypothetical protein